MKFFKAMKKDVMIKILTKTINTLKSSPFYMFSKKIRITFKKIYQNNLQLIQTNEK